MTRWNIRSLDDARHTATARDGDAKVRRDGAARARASRDDRAARARRVRRARWTRARADGTARTGTNGTERERRGESDASEAAADVFIARVPLEGMERIDGAVFGERGGPAGTSHWMVLVRHAGDEHAAVYDFLPKAPKSPITAAKLLSGNSVEGVVRSRRLAGVPGRRCCRVGGTRAGLGGRIAIEAAIAAFHERWDADALRLGTNDCRNHSVELARWLTCDYGYGIEVSSDAKGTLTCRRTATPATEEDEDEGSVDIVPVDVGRVSRDVATNASSKDRKNKKQKKKKSSGGPR